MTRSPWFARSLHSCVAMLALAGALVLAACGHVGDKVVPPYLGAVVGPGGAHLVAGQVDLVIPPGAIAQDMVIQILPQAPPLPIEDGGIVQMQLMCIGPLDQGLAVPGTVKFCYDPATIPPGLGANDVVLLVWDNQAGVLRVVPAVQDVALHCFTLPTYVRLGHIGVGARPKPARNLVFAANPPAALRAVVAGQAGPGFGLVLAGSSGPIAPQLLANTSGAEGYVGARDGTKVIWRSVDPMAETTKLLSSETSDSTLHVLLSPADSFLTSDPLYGSISASTVYTARDRFFDDVSHDTVSTVGVTGVPAPNDLYFDASPTGQLIDVRVSPDETMLMLRYRESGEGTFDTLVIIDAATGAEVGTFLPGVENTSATTPRWLPDSSGFYFVEAGGQNVLRFDPNGTPRPTLYTMPAQPGAFIQDFVVAPSFGTVPLASTPCAYVRGTNAVAGQSTAIVIANDSFFVRDVLGGGALASQDLLAPVNVLELIYHPGGATVIADLVDARILGSKALTLFGETVHFFDATTAAELHSFRTSLEAFDVERTTGEVVVWFPVDGIDPNFPTAGLYRLASNGDTLGTISTGAFIQTGVARYLLSWRRTPGESASVIR